MAIKRYNFIETLEEYNKEHATQYTIPGTVTKAIIFHDCGKNLFKVKFVGILNHKKEYSLPDFIYHFMVGNFPTESFKAFIERKNDDSLHLEIKILPPCKIRYAYLQNNYFSGAGPLGTSCMRSQEMQKSLNFYIKNHAKIVVLIDKNNKIHARALLWGNVKSINRKSMFVYLDRVYSNSEHHVPLFYNLAKENKWKYYNSNSAGQGNKTYYIDNLDITGVCYLPFTDTFKYLFYKDKLVTSSLTDSIIAKTKNNSSYTSLNATQNGGYRPNLDANRVQEVITCNYISKKDAIKVKRYSGYVLKKNIVNINGNYFSVHDDKIVKSKFDGFIFSENSVNEIITNEIIDKNKATYSSKYNGYLHKHYIIHIKGKIYHKKDINIVCFDNKWYHISECFINYNREDVNRELSKRGSLFSMNTHGIFRKLQMIIQSLAPDIIPIREDSLIPQKYAIIAYNLVYNPILSNVEYQELYLPNDCPKNIFIKINTGVYIIKSPENRRYLKKFNNKWYIKQDFEAPNKNQLMLFK